MTPVIDSSSIPKIKRHHRDRAVIITSLRPPSTAGPNSPSTSDDSADQIFAADGSLKVCFVSDLHLLSRRSTGLQNRDVIAAAISASGLCVWGGDLFDLRWSTLPPHESIAFAMQWLDSWRNQFPNVRFAYLFGNHDCDPDFRVALARWNQHLADQQKLVVDPCDVLRIGGHLFFHGDVIERGATAEGFLTYRQQWSQKQPAAEWRNRLYDVAVAGRLHRGVAAVAHRNNSVCRKLARWTRANFGDLIHTVVFGHTHRRIIAEVVDGITFYNGGAAIRHIDFSPVQVTVFPD